MGVIVLYIDTVLVPLSLLIAVGYHVFLWHSFKHNPYRTSLGLHSLHRTSWFRHIKHGDDKTGMLAVQSLRNTKMVAILTASISILVYVSLAAVINSAFMGSHLLMSTSDVFGSQNPRIFAVKYGSASLLLLASFFCSSLGVGYLVDAIFLINAMTEADADADADATADEGMRREYARLVMERGFVMATVGNRVMCIAIPLLLWMFGPLPVAASSLCLVSLLYHLDFPPAPPPPPYTT